MKETKNEIVKEVNDGLAIDNYNLGVENSKLRNEKQKAIAACKRYREIIKQYAEINQKLSNDFEAVCKTLNERIKVTQHLNEIIKEQEIKIARLATIIDERGLVEKKAEN